MKKPVKMKPSALKMHHFVQYPSGTEHIMFLRREGGLSRGFSDDPDSWDPNDFEPVSPKAADKEAAVLGQPSKSGPAD